MINVMDIDVQSAAFFSDPYPTLRRLREESPIYYSQSAQSFLLTHATMIEAAAQDPSFSCRRLEQLFDGVGLLRSSETSRRLVEVWSRCASFQDDPRHTLVRRIIQKGLSSETLDAMRPRFATFAPTLLDTLRDGEVDVITAFAAPLADFTLCEMFAIPLTERAEFLRLCASLNEPSSPDPSREEIEEAERNCLKLMDYLNDLVAERLRRPGHDVVSRMVAVEDRNAELVGEAAIQCLQLSAAGGLTVRNQLGNAILAFLRHPEELHRLQNEPGLLPRAIEETLRYEPATLSFSRLCIRDTKLAGQEVAKGQSVTLVLAAVNRDPALFPDADRFDITRTPNKHVAFGVGRHYCPGGPMFRLQLESALRSLLTFPRWELSVRPPSYSGCTLQDRGPSALYARFHSSAT